MKKSNKTKTLWYEQDENGDLIKRSGDSLPGGVYRTVNGTWPVRISDRTRGATHFAKSDDLGTHGILNHADGKVYDSRSKYYQAISAAGCHIAEADSRPKSKGDIRGDFNVRKELKAAVHKHVGGTNGRRKSK